jgi:hypothetical protein
MDIQRGNLLGRVANLESLNGQPVQLRHEMGGFCLGSTSVLVFVFEVSPTFEFAVHAGQKWRPRCEWGRNWEMYSKERRDRCNSSRKLLTRMNWVIDTTKCSFMPGSSELIKRKRERVREWKWMPLLVLTRNAYEIK